ELVDAAAHEFDRLWLAVDAVPEAQRETPGACDAWSVKDLLAHLHAWHEMALGWEREGSAGTTPQQPAPGYTWAETPALNQAIFERTRDDEWSDVDSRLRRTHDQIVAVIESYGNDDLFTKKRYRWTGSTSVGAYMVSATSSHYAWASKLIRKWTKALAKETTSE
ncbi:MAG: ClbS/DfsB family four-helix bundle protein, partial [Acidimicrobiales bacterium]|nr:ClbS/DfsB family four-helix bundle protein [Acidimicrobiales bacterium]